MITLVLMIFAAGVLLQGCYTIVDLPEISYDEYTYTPVPIYQPELPTGGPWPPPKPRPPHPPYHPPVIVPIITGPPVTITNPRPITREDDIQKIRDDGNGRGNSGRNRDLNNNTKTRTDTNSNSNNNSSTNSDNTLGSSNSGNPGNTRR